MTEEVRFEKAMERLEKIVEDLETGNLSLDEALKKYEEGIKLSRICRERLSQAEKKIEILTRSADGSLKKEPFDPEAAAAAPEKAVKKGRLGSKSASHSSSGSDEDILF